MASLSAVLVLLAGLSRSAHAQAAAQCFLLTRDSPCGEDYGGFPIQTATFANQAEFTSLLQTGIADLDNVAKAFNTNYGCSAATVRPALDSMRFQVSHSCSNFVNEALKAGCRPSPAQPNKNPILCQERCDFATSTLMMVLGNATACPPASAEIMTRRSNAVNRFDTYCKAMGPQGVNACTLGAVNERDLCGWRSQNVAIAQCSTNFNDVCCNNLLAKFGIKRASDSSSGGMSTILLGAIVGGAILIVGALAGFGFVYFRRNSNSRVKSDRRGSLDNGQYNSYGSNGKSQQRQQNNEYGMSTPPHQHKTTPTWNNVHGDRPTGSNHSFGNNDTITRSAQPKKLAPVAAYGMYDAVDTSSPAPQSSNTNIPTTPLIAHTATASLLASPSSPSGSGTPGPVALPLVSAIPEGAKPMHVLHAYEPSLPDELRLEVGREIMMVRAFDDGWALGYNPETFQQGAFPLVCVVEAAPPVPVVPASAVSHVSASDVGASSVLTSGPVSSLMGRENRSSVLSVSRRVSSQIISQADRETVSKLINSAQSSTVGGASDKSRQMAQLDVQMQQMERELGMMAASSAASASASGSGAAGRTAETAAERRLREREAEAERLRVEELERQRRREERERDRLAREQERLRLEQERLDRERERIQRELYERQQQDRYYASGAGGAQMSMSQESQKKQPMGRYLADLETDLDVSASAPATKSPIARTLDNDL